MTEEKHLPFIDHLVELRKRLIIIVVAVIIGMGVSWSFSNSLLSFIERPLTGHTYLTELKKRVYEEAQKRFPAIYKRYDLGKEDVVKDKDRPLNYSAPLEPFFIQCKISIIAGFILVLPIVFYQVWLFAAPGMTRKEKRLVVPFVTTSTVSFCVGALFFLIIIWPVIINFSLSYEAEGLRSWFNLTAYVNFCLRLILIFGLIFELPIVSLLLSRFGIVNYGLLARNRKYALLASAVIAAFHADLVTMFVVMAPLYIMYEISIWVAFVFGKKKRQSPRNRRDMKIIRRLEDLREKLPNPAVTIGNFDGVHLGHREIFRRVIGEAANMGGVSVAVTFFPHPLKVLAPENSFKLITTYEEKERLIGSSGIDYLISIPFSRAFAEIPARNFVRDILVDRIGVKKIMIGYDYAFGQNREGNVDLLRQLGTEYGFEVEMIEQIGDGITAFSSSVIRSLIEVGDVKGAHPFLGRYFSVGGPVVHGLHRGKKFGFPTANIEPEEELLPKPGVYAVKVIYNGNVYDGACNVGFNPTFNNGKLAVEIHILDFHGDIYGRDLKVYFVERIRDEKVFSGVEELIEAIRADILACRVILSAATLAGNGQEG